MPSRSPTSRCARRSSISSMRACWAARRGRCLPMYERLKLLPPYLQQLEMESNGKSVKADARRSTGRRRRSPGAGWGRTPQHAVFQLLHQGTHVVPVEFLSGDRTGRRARSGRITRLLVNCFAQGAALMRGKENDADPARAYPGNRPSTTILIDELTPHTLGALIAFYEHRTFSNGILMESTASISSAWSWARTLPVDREGRSAGLRSLDHGADCAGAGMRRSIRAVIASGAKQSSGATWIAPDSAPRNDDA